MADATSSPSRQNPPPHGTTLPAPADPPRTADLAPFMAFHGTKKRAFLLAYAKLGVLQKAADACQIDVTNHYHWKRTDPAYLAAFADAQEMAADLHEDEASRRALGWDETRIGENGTPYTIRKYSDTLLIFRLKALLPDKYRDHGKRHEHDLSDLLKAVLLELQPPREAPTPEPPALEVPWT